MEMESFLQNCLQRGIRLQAENGKLRYRAKKGVITEEILKTLRNRKTEILDYLKRMACSNSQFQLFSTSQNRAPLLNQGIWKCYSSHKMEHAAKGNVNIIFRRTGEIQIDAVVKSIIVLLERHKALNSAIEMTGENLYLVHHPNLVPAFHEIIVKGDTDEYREQEAMRIANDLAWKELDLECGPLYRSFLIKITETDFIIGMVLHHAITDGLSMGIISDEFSRIYFSIVSNTPSSLPPVRFQFIDYLSSMKTWLASEIGVGEIGYWVDHLKSVPETQLLTSGRLSKVQSYPAPAKKEIIIFNSDITREIEKIITKLKTTLFTVLLAAHKVAIWRMTAQEELVILGVNAGRINADFESMIGEFTLEIAYKTSLKGNPNFVEIIERVKQTIINAESYQPVPFDYIRRQLLEKGITFSAPVMNIMPGVGKNVYDSSGPSLLTFPFPESSTDIHCPSLMMLNSYYKKIVITLGYNTDLYEKSTVKLFIEHFRKAITTFINNPEKRLYEY